MLLVLSSFALSVSAADYEPTVKIVDSNVLYMKYQGDNANDGLTPQTPKATWGDATDPNTVAGYFAANKGGTLVTPGKFYVGAVYTVPAFEHAIKLTAKDANQSYIDRTESNPNGTAGPDAGVFKIKNNCSITFQSDVLFDDILIYQEFTSETSIMITNNSTLEFGPNVEWLSVNDLDYITIYCDMGSTVIFNNEFPGKALGTGNIEYRGGAPVTQPIITTPVVDTPTQPPVGDDTTAPETSDALMYVSIAAIAAITFITTLLVTVKRRKNR
jgi:hypothetical protein